MRAEKQSERDGRKEEHSVIKQEALVRTMVIGDLYLDFKATVDEKETIKLESSCNSEVSQCKEEHTPLSPGSQGRK